MVANVYTDLSRIIGWNEESVLAQEVGRHAFILPHDPDDAERIILGVLALYERLDSLESLEPNPQNSKLFNQLFDLVTMSKTTAAQDHKVCEEFDKMITKVG
jgi:hypothetical protein